MSYSHSSERLRNIYVSGIPKDVSESEAAVYRSRIISATEKLLNSTILENITLNISTLQLSESNINESTNRLKEKLKDEDAVDDELSIEERARRYTSMNPRHTFEKLVFQDDLKLKIGYEVKALSALSIVHNILNYKSVKPVQRRGLILGGEPGTGKTSVAHAIASKAGLPILTVTAADIESKFHGEGTKNLKAAFYAAWRDSALLHIEEAESLCSQRLDEVSTGSEQSINSLRNQLFSCLDEYPVPTICTTNAAQNLDKALETRLRYIHIPMPDERCRKEIWDKCLTIPGRLHLGSSVSTVELAKIDNVCGREISDAVEDAALKAVLRTLDQNKEPIEACITQGDLLSSIEDARSRRISSSQGQALTDSDKEEIGGRLRELVSQAEDGRDTPNTTYVLFKDSTSLENSRDGKSK
ncbi:atpase aaa [Leptolyngbya sp. Heron Island J]|uniref:ATP-binding protein n=1 Tax=Leptolyngbya sp. Heron Island J TaxID=1385935 RepID=UPI0003B97CD3|nr:ATP-binding protein [Leptolyngbya sp. Heron Island J]ESA37121.1 atpase aaa [Leptolyngbya sp. Heron Island J]